jgi:hypothetical protein
MTFCKRSPLSARFHFFSESEQPASGAFVCWLQRLFADSQLSSLFALAFGRFNSDKEIFILLHVQKWFS